VELDFPALKRRIALKRFSPFDQSLWFATTPAAPTTVALEGRVQADVCIVGAGYTGLTTALEIARKGVNVVVLEAQEVGFGGSGRNAGHSTPTFVHFSLPELRQLLEEPWAERLIARQTRANDRVSEMIHRYQIQCEWQQNGYVMAANRPTAIPYLEQKMRDYNAVGAKTQFLDKSEVETFTGSPRFYGGWLHTEGGHLNPLAYARGLARAVIREGATLFTSSSVINVTPESGRWIAHTETGSVVADKIIFATGAYTVGGWPKLDQSFKVMRAFVAATQPLSPESRKHVLPHNTAMHDGRGDIYVYKYNAEGRIVASMFPMGRRGCDMDYTRQVMTERLKWLHPQLKENIRWEYFWFGELDMQRRTIPRLYGLAPGVVALTGLSGRGVPTGSMLGEVLAEWAMDVPEKDLSLKVEPLHKAPYYMNYAPQLTLRYYRVRDWLLAKRDGAELPPHA
jgi:glycine/D-amino acid oxidase-like deaminating enzyme